MATAGEILEEALQRADMEGSGFISPEEGLKYVSKAYKALYDLLVSKLQDYHLTELPFKISGTSSYSLPSDFYKLRGVDRLADAASGIYYPLDKFEFYERSGLADTGVDGSYKLWFTPKAASITSEDDEIDGVNGWEDYIVLSVAVKAIQKEEGDASILMAERSEIINRINAMSASRDTSRSSKIQDIHIRRRYPDVRYAIMGNTLRLMSNANKAFY